MSNIWEDRITKVVKKLIRTEYPHVEKPAAVRARISKAAAPAYSIVILDENLERDAAYPEIPEVKSELIFKKDDMVAVIFLDGSDAYIVGKL